MSEKSVFINILVALAAFTAGWFAHQELRPFISPPDEAMPLKIATPGQLAQTSRVIFTADKTGNYRDQKIRVEQVTMLQELPDSVLMEVKYHYDGAAPANEVKMFVGMESKYLYLGNDTIHPGDGVLRLAIGMIESDMKQDQIQNFKTERMHISFEHYPPGAYQGVLATTKIPYSKEWKLP